MGTTLPKYLVSGYSPLRVPTVPCELDRKFPVQPGTLYVPGVSVRDLCGIGNPLTQPLVIQGSGIGAAVTNVPAASTYTKTTAAQRALFNSGNCALFCVAYAYGGNPNAYGAGWFGFLPNTTNASPYQDFSIGNGLLYLSTGGDGITASWNAAGSWTNAGISSYGASGWTGTQAATRYVVVVNWRGTSVDLWLNGVLWKTMTGQTFPTFNASTGVLYFNGGQGTTTANAYIAAGGAFSHTLSSNEIELLSAQPFGMLQPIKSRTWFFLNQSGVVSYAPSWLLELL